MRLSHKHKFVFIAVPKTASSTIRNCLDEYSDIKDVGDNTSPYYWHTTAFDLKKHFNEKNWNWNEYFSFAFVRNPWAKLVSNYFYKLNVTKKWKDEEPEKYVNWKKSTFEDYILEKNKVGIERTMSANLQLSYLTDANGKQIVDFIGKVENLQEDFDFVCDKIGIPKQQLPHKNKTKHKHYTEYYDDETRQIVTEKYAKDIEYFGYKFGE